jgi:hypothetical protein
MTRQSNGRQQTIEILSVYVFFFLFFSFLYIYIYIYVLIKYISTRIVWNKYLEYMNIVLANMILSK